MTSQQARAPFTVRHGELVVHCGDEQAFVTALERVQESVVGKVSDSMIRRKLMEVNQRLRETVNAETGEVFSGLGAADKVIRQRAGNKMAKRIAALHTS